MFVLSPKNFMNVRFRHFGAWCVYIGDCWVKWS
nr:MAG TPA: hypothetical protein [Caudoviricetes sp.]